MKKRFQLFMGLLFFVCPQLLPQESHSWVQTSSQSDPNVLLKQTSSCFYYTVNGKGSDDVGFERLQAVVRTSFSTWEDVDCSYFRFVETLPSDIDEVAFHPDRGNLNLLVWREVASEWVFSKAAVAMTTVQHDPKTGVIYDTDIEFNGAWYTFGAEPSYPINTTVTDLENTITHEIGHTVGLDHTDDPSATMYSDSGSGEVKKRSLDDDDIEGLCSLYPLDDDPEKCEEPYCGLGLYAGDGDCSGVYGEDDGDCFCGFVGRKRGKSAHHFAFFLQLLFGIDPS